MPRLAPVIRTTKGLGRVVLLGSVGPEGWW
jgi:hypothetical protein